MHLRKLRFLVFFVFYIFGKGAVAAPILSLNAKASSLGNAVTAENVGVDSTQFNPATLTQLSTGDKGMYQELKLIALPFPNYKIKPTKPSSDEDPFNDLNVFVNDCQGACLLGENDPRDNPWEPEIERLAIYVPGYGEVDFDADLANFIVAPSLSRVFRSHRTSDFTFATSIYVPVAGGVHLKKEDWNIRQTTASVGVFGLTPSFAYKVTPSWSIGGGINFAIAGAKVGFDYRYPGAFTGAVNEIFDALCPGGGNSIFDTCNFDNPSYADPNQTLYHFYFEGKDKFTWSFNAGVLWEPQPWISLGISYRHKSEFKIRGKGGLILNDNIFDLFRGISEDVPFFDDLFLSNSTAEQEYTGTGQIDFVLPTQLDAGLSVQITTKLKLNIDYHWRESSLLNKTAISIDHINEESGEGIVPFLFLLFTGRYEYGLPQTVALNSAPLLGLKFKDNGNFAYGLTYQYSERVTLRTGYEKRPSAFDGPKPIGALDEVETIGIGINYKWDSDTHFDLTYVNLSASHEAAAGESVLTEVYFNPLAMFAGMHLSTSVEADILQVTWAKRL